MKLRPSLLFFAVLATASSLSAQTLISFTFSGTADDNQLGYVEDQAVSFTFVFADNAPVLTADGQNSVTWQDYGNPSERLFESVSGTGITGTWLAPVEDGGASSNSRFWVARSPTERFSLDIFTWDYSDTPVNTGGLQANGFDLGQIKLSEFGANSLGFGTLPSTGSPVSFLTGMIGSYDLSSNALGAEIFDIGDNDSVTFTITNVTISSVSAVPEPSTYAAILGGLALTGAATRRRRAPKRV